MLDWWGPIIWEYYAGSEGNGSTTISPQEWLAHPGSVGKPMMVGVHVCGEDGEELPAGQAGLIYFDGGAEFAYHNDPEKTQAARHPREASWSTLGDIGYLDDEGYLYLTDRKAFMIISGGVNIYPQEAENVLILHPAVADVAVFGVPDPEMGEQVKAVVQPAPGVMADEALARELQEFCRSRLSRIKCPRSVDFAEALPRHDNGKLYKAKLRAAYVEAGRPGAASA